MKEHFLKLYDYEAWANAQVIESALTIEEIPEKVLAIFSHLLAAQKIWYQRLFQGNSDTVVWPSYSPDTWLEESNANASNFTNFIQTLEGDDFQQIIAYKNSKGHAYETSILDIINHVLLHSSYHRGQIIQFIKPHVNTLPWVDYIFYLREKD